MDEENRSAGAGDAEISAIQAIVSALERLDEPGRNRVLGYVSGRFGTGQEAAIFSSPGPPLAVPAGELAPAPAVRHDIRSLREQKSPKSANEMAALAAYYLSELAPEADRKSEIGASDLVKQFKAAGFRLPGNPRQTLINAKNSGYLDQAGRGLFKINPVGYNLVVHRLGSNGTK